MFSEARKLKLIEAILKIDADSSVLIEMETVLSEKALKRPTENRFKELSGIWTKEDGDEMTKTIDDACENIDVNDWK